MDSDIDLWGHHGFCSRLLPGPYLLQTHWPYSGHMPPDSNMGSRLVTSQDRQRRQTELSQPDLCPRTQQTVTRDWDLEGKASGSSEDGGLRARTVDMRQGYMKRRRWQKRLRFWNTFSGWRTFSCLRHQGRDSWLFSSLLHPQCLECVTYTTGSTHISQSFVNYLLSACYVLGACEWFTFMELRV